MRNPREYTNFESAIHNPRGVLESAMIVAYPPRKLTYHLDRFVKEFSADPVSRIVTLIGPPGVGKTTLIHQARVYLDQHHVPSRETSWERARSILIAETGEESAARWSDEERKRANQLIVDAALSPFEGVTFVEVVGVGSVDRGRSAAHELSRHPYATSVIMVPNTALQDRSISLRERVQEAADEQALKVLNKFNIFLDDVGLRKPLTIEALGSLIKSWVASMGNRMHVEQIRREIEDVVSGIKVDPIRLKEDQAKAAGSVIMGTDDPYYHHIVHTITERERRLGHSGSELLSSTEAEIEFLQKYMKYMADIYPQTELDDAHRDIITVYNSPIQEPIILRIRDIQENVKNRKVNRS